MFVCELDENRLLAEMILTIIVRLIREHVTSLEQKNAEVYTWKHHTHTHTLSLSQILLKAEKTAAILHHFLPNGQLLFMNHKLIAQNERQLERTLAAK